MFGVLKRVENKNLDADTDIRHELQNVREDIKNKVSEKKKKNFFKERFRFLLNR